MAIPFLDTFVNPGHNKGGSSTELPSDGATAGQVGAILDSLSNAADGVSGIVNAFQGRVENGKAKQTLVQSSETQTLAWLRYWPLVAVLGGGFLVYWFFFRKR